MRRAFPRFLCLPLILALLSAPASAEQDLSRMKIANGHVAAVHTLDILAPYSGTLRSFDWAPGDTVEAGTLLFSMETFSVRAQEDGVIAAFYGRKGDSCQQVIGRYGALGALEPSAAWRIQASTQQAYNKPRNKEIHVGEELHFRSSSDFRQEGTARVIRVEGSGYLLDILTGSPDLNAQVDLFRSDAYAQDQKVGSGTVLRRDPVYLAGEGVLDQVLVSPGSHVKGGDVLFTLMSADADPEASSELSAPQGGVVQSLGVSPAQQVWKGQLLMRLALSGEMEVIAEVDEADLRHVQVGSTVSVTLDTDSGTVLTGKVTEIGQLGQTRQNAAYFPVHVSIQSPLAMLGGSASVYLPRESR